MPHLDSLIKQQHLKNFPWDYNMNEDEIVIKLWLENLFLQPIQFVHK